jgi:hypothetical protein
MEKYYTELEEGTVVTQTETTKRALLDEYNKEIEKAKKAYVDTYRATGDHHEAYKSENDITNAAQKSYEEKARLLDKNEIPSVIQRAFFDWNTNVAYVNEHNWMVKDNGKGKRGIAPWNKEVKAIYGTDSEHLHQDAEKWAKGKNLPKYAFERLKDINQDRRTVAREVDAQRSNKVTIEPYDPRVRKWKENPGTMDVMGVDSPPGAKATSIPREERARISERVKGGLSGHRMPRITSRTSRLR